MTLDLINKKLEDDTFGLRVYFSSWELNENNNYLFFDRDNCINLENVDKIIWEKSKQSFDAEAYIEEGSWVYDADLHLGDGLIKDIKFASKDFSYKLEKFLEKNPVDVEGKYSITGNAFFDWDDLEIAFEIESVELIGD